jgi:putative sterol carrier protein
VEEAMAITTIDEYLAAMQAAFVPERARGAHAVLQYHFTGSQTGACYAAIEGGALQVARGTHPAPNATVTIDFDLWMRILAYEVDGLLAAEDGLYTASGDLETLMISDTWFRR